MHDHGLRLHLAPWGPLALRAVSAALAAALAWMVVQPWGGLAESYPYYAPLGAVIAVSGTVVASARGASSAVRNLVLGALLGTVVLQLGLPSVLGLAVVVAVGTALHGIPRLTTDAPWVAYSGVFVLIVGAADPLTYGVAYAGLTSLGALIGIGVTALLPPLLITPGSSVLADSGETLAAQLDDLADALRLEEPPTDQEWARRRHALLPALRATADQMRLVSEARRGNWRARWWQSTSEQQLLLAEVVGQAYAHVEHLTQVLVRDERAGLDEVALGLPLRGAAADGLTAWAALLRDLTQGRDHRVAADDLGRAIAQLATRVRTLRSASDSDLFTAGAVVCSMRRGLEAADERPRG